MCLHDPFLRRAGSRKGGLSGSSITFHSSNQAFTKRTTILNGVGSKSVVAQITGGASNAIGIALSQTQENTSNGQANAGRGILLNNRFDKFMQRMRVCFPEDIQERAVNSRVEVIWFELEDAIQNDRVFAIIAQGLIAGRNLLKDKYIVWVQLEGALQVTRRLRPATLPTVDVTAPLENSRIVWLRATGGFNFRPGAVIIKFTIEVACLSQMGFARVRLQS